MLCMNMFVNSSEQQCPDASILICIDFVTEVIFSNRNGICLGTSHMHSIRSSFGRCTRTVLYRRLGNDCRSMGR